MNFRRLFLMLTVIIIFSTTVLIAQNQPAPGSNTDTSDHPSFCDLIKNPEMHDGKEVTVSATVRWSSALQEMYCRNCEGLGRTRIEVNESAATPGLKRFKKLFSKRSGTVNATFTGKFSAKGSLSANYTFFVTDVRKIEYYQVRRTR